ncbi:exopolysaccharide biosynthesis polyprenyl glycosylphosphotransferase [Rugosimonospora acidiphila]|uniref:Exopolysaccharide biosynthesis polyprenyl glycosylphosphotransferase n=1 Tax=Rugosimonospora acidiphila TaxID=556531 RepID=A0ABP9RSS9_9ACTN
MEISGSAAGACGPTTARGPMADPPGADEIAADQFAAEGVPGAGSSLPDETPAGSGYDGGGYDGESRVPRPRTGGRGVSPDEPGTLAPAPPRVRPGSGRRRLRAWMLTAPMDLLALLVPLAISTRYWRGTLSAAALTMVFFAAGGLYRVRRHISILDELPNLCGRLLAAAAVVGIIAAVRHDSVGYGTGFMQGVALSAGSVIVGRMLSRNLALIARRKRWVEHNAIVIGCGPIGVALARTLQNYPRYGLRFVGYVDAEARGGTAPVRLAGTLDDLPAAVAMTHCDVIIIADPDCGESTLMEFMRQPGCARCELWVVPRLWGSRSHGALSDHVGAIPVVQIANTTLSGPRWAIKRGSDIVVASLALVLLSPVLLLCALATWLDGGPGILFRQERIGRDGVPIEVIKFRTMRPRDDAESRTKWSIANDQRVSAVGRFMRRTSLDELPQFWNVLRGDMTVVGPRPERPYFVEKFSAEYPDYAMRHRVQAGLTGLAQVSGFRGDTPIPDRARFDNYYIENWSLWLDTKVLLRTITEVFRRSGR